MPIKQRNVKQKTRTSNTPNEPPISTLANHSWQWKEFAVGVIVGIALIVALVGVWVVKGTTSTHYEACGKVRRGIGGCVQEIVTSSSSESSMLSSSLNQLHSLKLTYFDIRGRAEPIRMMLAEGGVEWEEERLSADEWQSRKSLLLQQQQQQQHHPHYHLHSPLPFDQLPVLQHGSVSIAQSEAILRHIGRITGYHSELEVDQVFSDMVAGGAEDFRRHYYRLVYPSATATPSNHSFLEDKERYINETLPKWLFYFERILTNNGGFFGKGHYFVANKLTWVDFAVFDVISINVALKPEIIRDYPMLKAFKERIQKRTNIKRYIKTKRPKATNGKSALFANGS